jgi:hypothetical protein
MLLVAQSPRLASCFGVVLLRRPQLHMQILKVAICRLLTDVSISYIAELHYLRCLDVHGCPLISLDGLKPLSKLTSLEHISIPPAARAASMDTVSVIAKDLPALQSALDSGLDCDPVLRVWDCPDITCWQPAISTLPPACVSLSPLEPHIWVHSPYLQCIFPCTSTKDW